MHGNYEFCRVERSARLGIGQIPYSPQNLVRKSSFFEYLLRNNAREQSVFSSGLLEQRRVLDDLFWR
jgi:hypothetical protein